MKTHYFFAMFFSALILVGASCGSKIEDGGIFKSWDTAENWEQKVYLGQDKKDRAVLIDDVDVSKLFIEPEHVQNIYAITSEGLYKTYTGGEQWKKLDVESEGMVFLAVDPNSTNVIYVARGTDILKSDQGGEGPFEVIYRDTQGGLISRIVVDWFNSKRLYAITTKGAIIKSDDEGVTWRTIHQTEGPLTELKMSSDDSRILYVMEAGIAVWKTDDGGQTWLNLFETTSEEQRRLKKEKEGKELIFEEVDDDKPSSANDDDDNTPRPAKPRLDFKESFPDSEEVLQLAIDPNDGDTLYITSAVGMLKTDDGGETWERIDTVISRESESQNAAIKNITVQPDDSDTILFTVDRLIHKTDDGGKTWKVIENFPSNREINALVFNTEDPNILYAGLRKPVEKKDNSLLIGY